MDIIIDRTTAVSSLVGNVGWYTINDEVFFTEEATSTPSALEIDAEVLRLQTIHDSQQYARDRAKAYPTIEECLHAILDDDLDALQAKRQAVKAKYPKES